MKTILILMMSITLNSYGQSTAKESGSLDATKLFGGVASNRVGDKDIDFNITKVIVNYKVVKSIDEAGPNDHIISILNKINVGMPTKDGSPTNESTIGFANENSYSGVVEKGTLAAGTFDNTILHELGHTLGLGHTPGALMNPTVNGKLTLNDYERGQIIKATGALGRSEGTYKKSVQQGTTNVAK